MVTNETSSNSHPRGGSLGGLFFVKLGAKTNIVESREEEDLGDKYAVRIVYALPREVHDALVKWRNRTWKRIRRRPSVEWGPLILFPESEYQDVIKVLEEARKEFEDIISELPDELRERLSFNPTVVFITAAPGFQSSLSEEVTGQVLEKVEETLRRTAEMLKDRGDYDVDARLREFEARLSARMEELRKELERTSMAAMNSEEFLALMKRIETLLLTIATSRKLGKRDVRRVKRALEEAERFSQYLTPEAREALGAIKSRLQDALSGEGESMKETAERLAKALQSALGERG